MIIVGGAVALPNAESPIKRDIEIVDGRIVAIGDRVGSEAGPTIDAAGMLVLPGVIDPHVHFDEPGYTDREDFFHGTSAAASGGVTTIVDMPGTSVPPVTNLANLMTKLAVIGKRAVVDFGLFGGVSGQVMESGFPESMVELSPFVLGYKTYFISGSDTFARVNHSQFQEILIAARGVGRPVLLHAEDYDYITGRMASDGGNAGGSASTEVAPKSATPRDFQALRPELAEILAVSAAAEIAEETGAEVHIVHVSTGRAAQIIGASDRLTGETAPHYLAFDLDDFDEIGSALKVTPPVQSAPNNQRLWGALIDGSLDFAASDHAPAPNEQKNTGSIFTDYAGIPGSGTLLPFLFSEGYQKKRITLRRLVEVTASAAARRYGIDDRKGALEVGKDGDCVIVSPQESWTVRGDSFLSKGKITPFEGMTFQGRVRKTIVRGREVFDAERGITVAAGYGGFVQRGTNA